MKNLIFTLFTILVIYGTSAQASDPEPENTEIELTFDPANLQLLKQFVYSFAKPDYHSKDNVPGKDAEKIFSYLDGLQSLDDDERLRAERDIKDIFNKIKNGIEKLFKGGKKRSVRQAPTDEKSEKPEEKKLEEKSKKPEDKKEEISDKKLGEKVKAFIQDVKQSFTKHFGKN